MPKDQNESLPPGSSRSPSLPTPIQSTSGKRGLPPNSTESPAKKQSKWSADEDALIIELRGSGMKWEDISNRLPGRSAISCRLHYQNYLERRSEWDEERKNKLARLYERFKQEMWSKIAEEMAMPWRATEAMHWQLGEQDMARRAGVVPFSLSNVALDAPVKGRRASSNNSRAKKDSTTRTVPPHPLPSVAELSPQSVTLPPLTSVSAGHSPTSSRRMERRGSTPPVFQAERHRRDK